MRLERIVPCAEPPSWRSVTTIRSLAVATAGRNGRIEKGLRIAAQVCHYPLVCRYIAVKLRGTGWKSSEDWTHNAIACDGEKVGHAVDDGLARRSEREIANPAGIKFDAVAGERPNRQRRAED
jgi:hypothetical protein